MLEYEVLEMVARCHRRGTIARRVDNRKHGGQMPLQKSKNLLPVEESKSCKVNHPKF